MTRAARTIFVFGIYIVAMGVLLTFVPGPTVRPFGFPEPHEPWIRVLGVVALVLGSYYIQAARENVVAFFRWTLWGRSMVLAGAVALVVAGVAPPGLIVFGVIDAAGAVWTALALRKERGPR